MTKREQLAAASRENADSLGVGLPTIIILAAQHYAGVEVPMELAMLAAGLLGSWGAKIKRHIQ